MSALRQGATIPNPSKSSSEPPQPGTAIPIPESTMSSDPNASLPTAAPGGPHQAQRAKPGKVANPTYQPLSYHDAGYKTFKSFYPYYLGEHNHPVNRRLHLVGTSVALTFQTRAALGAVPLVVQKIAEHSELAAKLLEQGWFKALALKDGWKGVGQLFGISVLTGYAAAWVGHFFFEKNRPATFKNPIFSLMGDYRMLWEVLTAQRDP